jgi:phage-related protein
MLVAVIINHWEEIKAAVGTAWTWFYDNVLAPIGAWFAGAASWFYDNVVTPIVNFFSPIVSAIVDGIVYIYNKAKEIVSGIITAVGSIFTKVSEIFLKIVEIMVALGKAAYDYGIKPVVDWIAGAAVWIYDTLIRPVIDFFKALGNLAHTYIIEPIYNGIVWLRDKAIGLFKKIGTTVVDFMSDLFKSVINGVLSTIEKNINKFIRLLNGAIDLINEIPGVSITKVSELSIPRLAEGGMVNEGQMFVAREAGPELVGTIGRRSAVVNNDQIVSSVSKGVYQAVVQAMGQSGGNQVVEAKVNDKVLFEVVVNRNRQETMRTGYSPLLGGA